MALKLNGLTVTSAINGSVTGSSASCTGTAATVTTNANLSGDVTSSGNVTTIASNAVTTVKIADSNVTLAKIVNISTGTFLGNNTVSAAAPLALTSAQAASMLSGQTMNIVGTATNVTGTVAVANGGTGGTTQALGRTGLGATTLGGNFFTLANQSTITFPRINADNTVSALDAAAFRTAIGAGTGGGSGTVTNVATGDGLSGGPITATGTITVDATVVRTTGAQTIGGTKTFSSQIIGSVNGTAGSVEALGIKTGQLDNNVVTFAKMQQVTGPVAVGKLSAGLGDLTTVDIHAGVNYEANKLVRTQANGYLLTGYISTESNDNNATAITKVYASHDDFIRYYTPTNFRTVLDVPTRGGSGASGNWAINAAGLSATLAVSSGGTGATSFTAGRVLFGNGTSAINTSANFFWDNTNSRLGIGTSPAYALDVNGTIHYTTLTASSDGRFKKNVQPIPNALDRLSYIRGVKFEWNEFINDRRNGYELNKPTFGVIAQELEEVFPELITLWKLSDDCTDARSVNYEKIIPILIEAVKELNNKNKLLESRLLILENK